MPTKHPRFKNLPEGIFSNLKNFRQLEARISELPDTSIQRGDALEIFVEAYLQIHPIFQVEELWLVNQIPVQIRQKLKLPSDGKGIDGIYRRTDGTLAPYQVKFRKGRPQVGVGDTASFFMLTEAADQRVLISNSDRYAKEIRDRKDLILIGGSSFDELSAEDFSRIDVWINGKTAIPRRKRSLRPDQARAVGAIVEHLQTGNRATAVMPCGTGKTLVGLRAVEELQARSVIVFVPSLALLAQLLEDWAKDTVWASRFRYLCVCSQSTVSSEVDRWELCPTDVHFPVTTNPSVIRAFLEQDRPKDSVCVVFSTYQSARKVAEALPKGFRFDAGVFDEAHKTTEGGFGLVLKDEEIPISRRLFLTATPRHIDIKRRDKEGEFKLVSMDDPEIYGPPAYVQSFAEAVSLGIICDYRIVVSVVDRSEISEYSERHGITLVQGDANSTRWVASQIAVAKAIQATGASKLITFHSRVNQAKEFVSHSPRGISQFLPGFRTGHVNGAQPVTDRKDVLKVFLDEGKMLVSNARCLTEGVDLPAVDAVVFNDPRRSKVDIVQAVGRAMRKPPSSMKELGYVVIPILLGQNQSEDLEEACSGTEWEDLVAVVAAMRGQDSRLEETIREAQEARGHGGVFNPQMFGERICIIGRPEISLGTIQTHISSLIVERLGQNWDYRYGELMAFKEIQGHCRVPQAENLQLAFWVVMQRQKFKKGMLSNERKARLDALEFVWDHHAAKWEEKCRQLEEFHSKNEHCRIPSNYPDKGINNWIANQRRARKEGKLSTSQIERLSKIGFEWDPFEESFEELCSQLQRYKLLHGDCNVPARCKEFKWLGEKLSKLREYYRKHDPKDSRAKRLIELGVALEPHKERFQLNYMGLMDFKQRHGHCNVTDDLAENKQLARWVTNLRSRKRQGRLDPYEIGKLEALGFDWDPKKAAELVWSLRVSELRSYILQHGNSHVPINYESNPELGKWWRNTRSSRNRGKLNKNIEKELDALGVEWKTDAGKWSGMLEQLKLYQIENGDCNVPCKYSKNPKLGRWVHTQRNQRKNGELSAERIRILDSINFWDYLGEGAPKQIPSALHHPDGIITFNPC